MVTVVVPVSPIKEHPEISIVSETIASVRHHLKDAEILLCFDGVREEQSDRRADYEEAIRRILWKADKQWKACVPFIFDRHLHQVGMLRRVIETIETPLMLFVEQDTPLVTDEFIAWDDITQFILSGQSNCVRLHHEGVLPKEHLPMMHGEECGYIRTSQFSARPHIATLAFYRQLLEHFSPEACSFVEDLAHGILDQAYKLDGMRGWNMWRLHIYAKDPNNLKRSLHLDGRAGEAKYDGEQVF
jgi:hypothetical protein